MILHVDCFSVGDSISIASQLLGTIDAPTAIATVWAGLSIFGLRRAVANNGTGQ